ncbi:unnamed protein product [Enterobius vermicularis]|uniref:Malate dehydrogenase n=1 Tax=Enterobius vermicularis TaxID=51028 RepID=A0A0N4V0C3_ENTVE|nr:unnamed protein product [Enterobius vermicularis]
MTAPIRVLVTGAAGQIGYSIVLQIAKGDVFGKDQPLVLVLLDIPPMMSALEGVQYELMDCALPILKEVIAVTDEKSAFTDIDYAFLVGAMPRKQGMERKDLLAANVKIFKSQGQALANFAKPTTKVIVVGNPANTNALICAKYAAPKVPERNFSAMTRLDHNRATAQIAQKCGVGIADVKDVIIWGNHSSTQYPDVRHAKVTKDGKTMDAYTAVGDDAYLQGPFISCVQKRGADEWVSMAVPSDGSYNVPKGLVFSFPVTIENGEWKIVQGLSWDDFAKEKIAITQKELEEERDEALQACA